MSNDFAKGCLAATLVIVIAVCCIAYVVMLIPWRGW